MPIFQKGKSVVKTTGNNEEKNAKSSEDEQASKLYDILRDLRTKEENG